MQNVFHENSNNKVVLGRLGYIIHQPERGAQSLLSETLLLKGAKVMKLDRLSVLVFVWMRKKSLDL